MSSTPLSAVELAQRLGVTFEQVMEIIRATQFSAQPPANGDKTTAEKPPVKDKEPDGMSDGMSDEMSDESDESDGELDDMEICIPDDEPDEEETNLASQIANAEKCLSDIQQANKVKNNALIEAKKTAEKIREEHQDALKKITEIEKQVKVGSDLYHEVRETLRNLRAAREKLNKERIAKKNAEIMRKLEDGSEQRRRKNQLAVLKALRNEPLNKKAKTSPKQVQTSSIPVTSATSPIPVTSVTSPILVTSATSPIPVAKVTDSTRTTTVSPAASVIPVVNIPRSPLSNKDITMEMVWNEQDSLILRKAPDEFKCKLVFPNIKITYASGFLNRIPETEEGRVRYVLGGVSSNYFWYREQPTKVAIICTIGKFAIVFGVRTTAPHYHECEIVTMGVSTYNNDYISPFRRDWKFLIGCDLPSVSRSNQYDNGYHGLQCQY